MDRVGAGVAADAAAHRGLQAQHPEHVGAVGVQRQLAAVAIRALAPVLAADVHHVADAVAERALRDRAPEVGAQPPEDGAEVVGGVAVERERPQDGEAAPVEDLVAPGREVGRDGREREVVAPDVLEGAARAAVDRERRVERGEVPLAERDRVRSIRVGEVARVPGGRADDRLVCRRHGHITASPVSRSDVGVEAVDGVDGFLDEEVDEVGGGSGRARAPAWPLQAE